MKPDVLRLTDKIFLLVFENQLDYIFFHKLSYYSWCEDHADCIKGNEQEENICKNKGFSKTKQF